MATAGIRSTAVIIANLFVLLFLLEPVAAYKTFYYADEFDRDDARDYAQRSRYDGVDPDNFNDFDDYNCVRLDDYNAFARYNRYDGYDPWSAKNINKKDFKRLRYEDQLRVANENPHDQWDLADVDGYEDMECWTLKDYNKFAKTKPRDRWDVVRFRDFDDLDTVKKVGRKRFHFFEPDDFAEFDLQHTRPRPRSYSYLSYG
jgi:hypothetical protein